MAESIASLISDSSLAQWSLIGSSGLAIAVVLWQLFGKGPRRRRGLRRAEKRLRQGRWQDARTRIQKLRGLGSLSAGWQKRFDEAEADCVERGFREALAAKNFEKALGFARDIGRLRHEPDTALRIEIQSAMLAEVRRLFSEGPVAPVYAMIEQTLNVQSPCREASFWQAMCLLRENRVDTALACLHTARTGGEVVAAEPAVVTSPFVDPPLYLGAVLLRQGQAKEALRYLTEANRIDSGCSVVTLQLGLAMIASGGDAQLAVRALQKALRALQAPTTAEQSWARAFPVGRSFVRLLAGRHPFVCPLWGGDVKVLIRQGNLALGQGLYRLGRYPEAAGVFAKLLDEAAPSLDLLRGLGLALARQGKYDDAFKHLRAAHELDPLDRVTAGYLALCGARGTPSSADAKQENVTWAVGLVSAFSAPRDEEWVGLIGDIFAEARAHQVPLALDEQVYLCEHLLSLHLSDPQSASAYLHLLATFPQSMRPEYAWLVCRAVARHGIDHADALAAFALTFKTVDEARAFYVERGWDFEELEFAYLQMAARHAPGRFPEVLGSEYAGRGRRLLLDRAHDEEKAGRLEEALISVDILARLAPLDAAALDRAAFLHYRLNRPTEAMQLLEEWQARHPQDPVPHVRQAVFLCEQRDGVQAFAKLRRALELSAGERRVEIACFAAKLALQAGMEGDRWSEDALRVAREFLEVAVVSDPRRLEGWWLLAAVCALQRAEARLREMTLDEAEAEDPRYHYFAALARWSAGDHARVIEIARRWSVRQEKRALVSSSAPTRNGAPEEPGIDWQAEMGYLAGLAHLAKNDHQGAKALLTPMSCSASGSARGIAQALLGKICFEEGRWQAAADWWQAVDARSRHAWKIAEPLAGVTFLAALEGLRAGRYEEAAETLRRAGKLGWRDRNLGALLIHALFRAGQQAFYQIPPTSEASLQESSHG